MLPTSRSIFVTGTNGDSVFACVRDRLNTLVKLNDCVSHFLSISKAPTYNAKHRHNIIIELLQFGSNRWERLSFELATCDTIGI